MSSEFVRESTEAGDVLDIPRRFKSYEIIGTIGVGGRAVVVEVRDVVKDEKFAAKAMRRPKAYSEDMRLLERELRLGETISCPHLVNCIEVVYLEQLVIVVMERATGIDLLTFVCDNPNVIIGHWKTMFRQVCLGVQYLHNRGLAHRDLKPENVMIDDDLNCRLCDYGFLCEASHGNVSSTKCGTLFYMSPEMLRDDPYDAKVSDIWSLGVLLYVMLTGSIPWRSQSDVGLMYEIGKGIIPSLELFSSHARDVILKCCVVKPENRATITQILEQTALRGNVSGIPTVSSMPMGHMREKKDIPTLQQLILKPRIMKVPSGSLFKSGQSPMQGQGPVPHQSPMSPRQLGTALATKVRVMPGLLYKRPLTLRRESDG